MKTKINSLLAWDNIARRSSKVSSFAKEELQLLITKDNMMKFAVMFCFVCLVSEPTFAQTISGNAYSSALTDTGKTIKDMFDSICNLLMIIGGVVGAIGAIRVYIKWQSGDQDVQKAVMGWGGATLFLVAAPALVKAIFLS